MKGRLGFVHIERGAHIVMGGGPSEEETAMFLTGEDLVRQAEACQIVWARIGSYPHWPAQIMTDEAAEASKLPRLKEAKRKKDALFPVMFFGDGTSVSWIKEKSLLTWSQGISKGCLAKKSEGIRQGLREVQMFLSTSETIDTNSLPGWWCNAPMAVEHPWPECSAPVQEKATDDAPVKNDAHVKTVPCIPVVNGKIQLSDRKREKLMHTFGSDAFVGGNAFPSYAHVTRNVWTVPRPKQCKGDDISVCNCHPMSYLIESLEENLPDNLPECQKEVVLQACCGPACLNRLSYMHCNKKICPCGDACQNKPFHMLESPKMDVFLTSSKGWGVRAAENINQGTFIVEYAGEVISEQEMSRRMEESKAQGHPHFYMMEMSNGLIIDARLRGNVARLLNSSCSPNCVTQKWRDALTGEIRVGIFAKRPILSGEELVYDYNFEHIMEGGVMKYACQCGAPKCRGSIETSQRHGPRDEGRRIEIWWDGDECYYPGVLKKYDSKTGLSTISYDDGMVENILLAEHEHRWVDPKTSTRKRTSPDGPTDEGRRIEIWWDGDECFYPGVLTNYDSTTGLSTISYDDGMVENILLAEHKHRWVDQKSSKQTRASPEDEPRQKHPCERLSEFLEESTKEEIDQLVHLLESANGTALSQFHVEAPGEVDSRPTYLYSTISDWFASISESEKQENMVKVKKQLAEALERLQADPPPDILAPVENPGAEQTAGSLHGNGSQNNESVSVSSRGRKRQKKVFGTDFEQDIEGLHNTKPSRASVRSPQRDRPRAIAKVAPLSPGMEAASIIAQLASSKNKSDEKRPSKGRSTMRGCGPTPASEGLPTRTILVAKRLTNSDVTKGRVLLPRAAVEANLSFAVGRAHSLVAKDHEGNTWEFTLQSWANGIETRRVFVLEHAGDYIRHYNLKIEDVIGISSTEQGEFMVEFNTDDVCTAAESQQAARAGGHASVNSSLPAIRPGSINPLVKQNSGRCTRSVHCNKPAGHPGFCMRTPASSRGKKASPGRGRGRGGVSRGRGKHLPSINRGYLQKEYKDAYSDGYSDAMSDDSAPNSQPNSAKYARDSDDDIFRRGGTLTPRFPNNSFEYFGNVKGEFDEGYGNEFSEEKVSTRDTKSRGPQLPKYPLPPPPELGPGVPPIFVMAQDTAPQYPPQLRSPLRPTIQTVGRNQSEHQVGTTQYSPSAAHIANLPNMGFKDDIEGVSPHAFHAHHATDMLKLGGNQTQSDYLSVLEGCSPTAAKYEQMTSGGQKKSSAGGIPAAPLPLFGAPPPPLGSSRGKGTASHSNPDESK